jgi:hypothetical protein
MNFAPGEVSIYTQARDTCRWQVTGSRPGSRLTVQQSTRVAVAPPRLPPSKLNKWNYTVLVWR